MALYIVSTMLWITYISGRSFGRPNERTCERTEYTRRDACGTLIAGSQTSDLMRLIRGARVGTSTWRGLKKGGGETDGDFWGEREQKRSNELSTVRSCVRSNARRGVPDPCRHALGSGGADDGR